MQKMVKAFLRILDGTPRHYSRGGQAGQSLVELAFITPLLAIMIVGIVEIGWYANHFLVMLEVARVGARSGTVLTGDLSPLGWNELASVHPIVYVDGLGKTTADIPQEAMQYRDCSLVTSKSGFYNFIACNMIESLAPLTMKGRDSTKLPNATTTVGKNVYDRYNNLIGVVPYPDDIVISAFSLQAVYNSSPATLLTQIPNKNTDPRGYAMATALFSRTYNFANNPLTATKYPAGSQVIVVGRYPKRANECNVFQNAGGVRSVALDGDPFDYIPNNARDSLVIKGQSKFIELDGYDPNVDSPEPAEAQLGFVWTGQHKRTNLKDSTGLLTALCWGSEWDNQKMADLMNFNTTDSTFFTGDAPGTKPWNMQKAFLPSQGAVLVEIFWQHSLLLSFPFIDPIVGIFGDRNNIIISAWAAFPVPSVESNIVYGLP